MCAPGAMHIVQCGRLVVIILHVYRIRCRGKGKGSNEGPRYNIFVFAGIFETGFVCGYMLKRALQKVCFLARVTRLLKCTHTSFATRVHTFDSSIKPPFASGWPHRTASMVCRFTYGCTLRPVVLCEWRDTPANSEPHADFATSQCAVCPS